MHGVETVKKDSRLAKFAGIQGIEQALKTVRGRSLPLGWLVGPVSTGPKLKLGFCMLVISR